MNSKEIQKKANEIFDSHPEVNEVFVTSDGYTFINENAMNLHINTNPSGKKLEFVKIERTAFETKPLSEMSVKDLKAFAKEQGIEVATKANKATTLEALLEGATKKAMDLGIEIPEGSSVDQIFDLIDKVANATVK